LRKDLGETPKLQAPGVTGALQRTLRATGLIENLGCPLACFNMEDWHSIARSSAARRWTVLRDCLAGPARGPLPGQAALTLVRPLLYDPWPSLRNALP